MKRTVLLFSLLIYKLVFSQDPCDNIGFEKGDFSTWDGYIGCAPEAQLWQAAQGYTYKQNCHYATGCCPQLGIVSNGTNTHISDSLSRHTLVTSAAGIDSCGQFSIVPPGAGTYVARLGNNHVWGESERLVTTFKVTPSSSIVIYRYAVVIQEPINYPHTPTETPFFEAIAFDQNGDTIPCTYLYSYAGDGTAGFIPSTVCTTYGGISGTAIDAIAWYKPWTSVALDLSAYMNLNVTIRFTTSDCGKSGHYGYAYIDANCGSLAATIDTVCSGQTSSFTAAGDTSVYTYSWSGPGGFTSTQQTITGISQAGDYNVTMTGKSGCSTMLTYKLVVVPNPSANFTFSGKCTLDIPFVDASSVSSGNIVSWDWNFGDAGTSILQNPTHSYVGGGNYNVTLIVTTNFGCKDTVVQPIKIDVVPVPDFLTGPVCLGGTTQFTDQSVISTGTITAWKWDFGVVPTATSTQQSPTYTYSSPGVYNVSLIVTSSGGCTDTIIKQDTIYPLPIADFSATSPCVGDETQFTDLSNVVTTWGDFIASYTWDFGDIGTSTLKDPKHTYTTAGTYNVKLTVITNNGCQAVITKPVRVNEMPVAAFLITEVCVGNPTCFTDQSTPKDSSITCWNWDFGDGSTSVQQNPCHTFAKAGTYSVKLTVCIGSCKNSTTVSVIVHPSPMADFTVNPDHTTVFDPNVTISDISVGGDFGKWNLGDATDSIDYVPGDNFSHEYPNDNKVGGLKFDIHLKIENNFGCKSTAVKSIVIDPYWTFYIPDAFTPNGKGTQDNETFFGKGIGILEYEMWIFDRWGNLIFHCNINDLPQDPLCHWDGKVQDGSSNEMAQQDVYVWMVKLTDIFNKKHKYIGHVSLVR